ncbi:hypothetical protein HZF24_06750 [Sedimentibacter hydroxybenzoicus DSM 7310]|uniref:Uncharacterized protein n=1 Tax=Sedimentibacter hydroxybenzoicus DSM 7310 TaxID=1123245 RepID=A0A974GW05_SEDHY|nr:hypothetical protein [Sedimentibacter hydroxybenzoicus]NYB73836.1 hypothetical protein [Sedimentibacter hydroxybenzoicus DSM 7310]
MKKHSFTAITFILLFLLFLYMSVKNVNIRRDNEKTHILEDAIIRSAVQAYAIEGFYPPDIEYMENNYGLIVDHEKYVISYNIFASNIMPEVEIFLKIGKD